jgi:hypothetical protein
VNVAFVISIFVVLTMMCRPPERAFLSGGAAKHSQKKLKDAAGGIAAVREISMVARGQGKHPDKIHSPT